RVLFRSQYSNALYDPNNVVKPISDFTPLDFADSDHKNRYVYFEKDPSIPASSYTNGISNIYFRCLMEFDEPNSNLPIGRYDYVSGYAQIELVGQAPSNPSLGYIKFKPVSFSDKSGENAVEYNPIALAGSQFGQLHLPKYVWDSPAFNENQTVIGDILSSLAQVFLNFKDGFINPNKAI